jgi:hypothetical protein
MVMGILMYLGCMGIIIIIVMIRMKKYLIINRKQLVIIIALQIPIQNPSSLSQQIPVTS